MVQRGYRVRVYTASQGYDCPENHYPRRENRDGVDIVRLPFSSFGKRTTAIRLLGPDQLSRADGPVAGC